MDNDGTLDVPASAEPLTRQLLRQMVAGALQLDPSELPGEHGDLIDHGLDSITTMRLISAWHRRGIEVGFPELMIRPTLGHWWDLVSRADPAQRLEAAPTAP
ncbi:phosphopantetheine-binding protein [Streptomyces sp. NPDC019990]|uniref:phosphopantetheine-binding protein n=1 Tax=Streptomyces sp. NPDC019990 TaxID=3154693 RepID=UPI0033ED5B8A